jgi:hypothetical protein
MSGFGRLGRITKCVGRATIHGTTSPGGACGVGSKRLSDIIDRHPGPVSGPDDRREVAW